MSSDVAPINALLRRAVRSRWSQVVGIGLQNFQAVRGPCFLPLSPLTLLYGPNSAGKSCIGDALQLVHVFGNADSIEPAAPLLLRWGNWDRESSLLSSEVTEHQRSTRVALWTVVAPGEWPFERAYDRLGGDYGHVFELLTGQAVPWALCVEFDWRQSEADRPKWCGAKVWMGSESEVPLLEFDRMPSNDAGDIVVRMKHPHYAALRGSCEEATRYPLDALLEEERPDELVAYTMGWGDHPRQTGIVQEYDDQDDFRACQFLMSVFSMFTCAAAIAANVAVTPPIRPIPDSRSSTFAVLPSQSSLLLSRTAEILTTAGAGPWYDIAADVVRPRTKYQLEQPWPSLLEYINHVLGTESLLGIGYRLATDIVPFGPELTSSGERAERGSLVHVRLTDDHGHSLELQDVGTGVSQLMPVLAALWSFSPAVIHQPELHLHPRLQSALGDVLLARPDRPYKIVESHSEHMLLRILRRIREANAPGKRKRHKVTPDDVTVLYFDPQDDGQTVVLNLRISDTGDFLDRWPSGFFTERDEDLGLV